MNPNDHSDRPPRGAEEAPSDVLTSIRAPIHCGATNGNDHYPHEPEGVAVDRLIKVLAEVAISVARRKSQDLAE